MPPAIVALVTLVDKVGALPLGGILLAVVVGPWVLAFLLARGQEQRFEAIKKMYEDNVELVKQYQELFQVQVKHGRNGPVDRYPGGQTGGAIMTLDDLKKYYVVDGMTLAQLVRMTDEFSKRQIQYRANRENWKQLREEYLKQSRDAVEMYNRACRALYDATFEDVDKTTTIRIDLDPQQVYAAVKAVTPEPNSVGGCPMSAGRRLKTGSYGARAVDG